MNRETETPSPNFFDTITRNSEQLAVLFADISDSTKLYNTLGDNAARSVVSACLTLIAEVVQRCHGRIVKTIGDEVMCVFRRTDDAVGAAREMQATIDAKRLGNYRVQIHIGLHYGPVLVEGDDVFGDTVNTAAYLTGVATAGQILTTEVTQANLSPEFKSNIRAVFNAVLKGTTSPSTVFQVLWHEDVDDMTYANFRPRIDSDGEAGSLLILHGATKLRMDASRVVITIGRGDDCDIRVDEMLASRKHVSIKLVRDHFYLVDHSLNGTFVMLEGGDEIHVCRQELLLERSGVLSAGRSASEGAAEFITFTRDRRNLRPV